jgi:glycosyltransferase involved in cell wall biosynthesis
MTFGREEPLVQVVGPADGWILERLGRRLASKLPYAAFTINQPDRGIGEGIAYYMNYALFQGPTSLIDVGFFTHLEDSHDFLGRARDMNCVCMSKKYADWLREQGVKHVTHIPMGFDYYRYRARLVLGVIGKLDHPRKGWHLVERVRELPFVEVVTTEGQIDDEQLRHVYQSTDYVLIPATVEGGPMSLLEGLAMGKPVIAPEDVGMVPEFGETPNLRRYRTGDFESLAEVLRDCYAEKTSATRLVVDRTWDRWAEDHHKLFKRLLKERGISFPEPAAGFRFGMMAELDIPPKLDVTRLESVVDIAAQHLYFGRYREARAKIEGMVNEYPFAGKLLETIPNG